MLRTEFSKRKKLSLPAYDSSLLHDACPLVAAHGRCTTVGEQVDPVHPGLDAESIEVGGFKNGFSFFFCGKVDGFNGFDPERFNDEPCKRDCVARPRLENKVPVGEYPFI